MSYFHDFTTPMQDWRENEASLGHDPQGDLHLARENARFLRDTYSDEDPNCDCRFSGDRADASECEQHNPRRRPSPHEPSLFDDACPAVKLTDKADDFLLDEGVR